MKKRVISLFLLFSFSFIIVFFSSQAILNVIEITDTKMSLYIALFISGFLLLTKLLNFKKKGAYKDIEHGSASWGRYKDIYPLIDKDFSMNLLFSDTERMSINMRVSKRNNHVLVIGGAGSGKSRYYVKPNVMQMNSSYVIADPKGEHLRDMGTMLAENGYKIKVMNIVDVTKSMKFNPFEYFEEYEDIARFVNILMSNTSTDSKKATEDFWVKAERLWFMSHLAYIHECCGYTERNFKSLLQLLDNSEAKDDDEEFVSSVDVLFDELKQQNPSSLAVKLYGQYKLAAGKTAKSILISIAVRMMAFNMPKISSLVEYDEMALSSLGEEKTALFIIIDDTDTTYNFLVAILLNTMFYTLKNVADTSPGGILKIPVSCYMDEFANIGTFPTIHILIATLRSRGVSLHIILQNLGQLQALYKDHADTIEGNCDTTLFLGGKSEKTQKYVSQFMVGKATIDTYSSGGSGGAGVGLNSYSQNQQKGGRSLIDENEVAKLDNNLCLVSIRGLPTFKSKKIQTEKLKNYKLLADSDNSRSYSYTKNQVKQISVNPLFHINIDGGNVL